MSPVPFIGECGTACQSASLFVERFDNTALLDAPHHRCIMIKLASVSFACGYWCDKISTLLLALPTMALHVFQTGLVFS